MTKREFLQTTLAVGAGALALPAFGFPLNVRPLDEDRDLRLFPYFFADDLIRLHQLSDVDEELIRAQSINRQVFQFGRAWEPTREEVVGILAESRTILSGEGPGRDRALTQYALCAGWAAAKILDDQFADGLSGPEAAVEVDVEIMLAEVGAPTESDLLLAGTADATVMSFGVNPAGSVKKAAERQGVTLKTYKIIYQLIEEVERMIRGQIEPEYEEQITGHAEVRQVIRVPRSGNIAGSYVTDGNIRRGAKARLIRGGKEVYKGSIAQLRRFKDDVREVGNGFECGINLQNYENVQEGDVIEVYEMVEVPV